MNREKVIKLIIKYGDLFVEEELKGYSDKQLYQTLRSLFIELRIKILKGKIEKLKSQ